jgi:hypothetical protein
VSKTNHRRGTVSQKDSERYKGGQHDYVLKRSVLTGESYDDTNHEHGRKPGREGSRRGKAATKRNVNAKLRHAENLAVRKLT